MNTLQDIADRVAAGHALTDDEAVVLLGAHDLIAIGVMADGVRQLMHGVATTFVRVFEVHVDAVPETLPSGVEGGEVRIVGRPASIDAACAAVRTARRLAAAVPLTGFSLADIAVWHESDAAAYRRLRDAGLDAIAEVPLDEPGSPEAALDDAMRAGLLAPRLTVDRPAEDPVARFRQAVQLQQATGAFRTFAPLPRTLSLVEPTTGYDDVKGIALARLMVRIVPSIQVDWPLYGPKLAQVALTVGADDVDRVPAIEAGELGRRRTAVEEIRRNIRAAGMEPVERTGRYERVARTAAAP